MAGRRMRNMRKCLIALISLFSAAALAAPAWTWVDGQGRRHYSDVPVEGATQIELRGSQGFSGAALQPTRNTAATASLTGEGDEPPPVSYSVLEIVSPTPEETLRNIGGVLPVEVATYPALSVNHRFDVLLDGERRQLGSRSLQFTLSDVFRGEHTLGILVIDVEGREIARSAPVRFFVHQTSVN